MTNISGIDEYIEKRVYAVAASADEVMANQHTKTMPNYL